MVSVMKRYSNTVFANETIVITDPILFTTALMTPGRTWITFYPFLSSVRVIWVTIMGFRRLCKVMCFSFFFWLSFPFWLLFARVLAGLLGWLLAA